MIPICLRVVGSSTGNRRSASCLAGSDSIKSETAKAIDYSLKRWPAFTRSRACLIIQLSGSPSSCPGIGEGKISPQKQLDQDKRLIDYRLAPQPA